MAIGAPEAKILFYSTTLGVSFDRTLTLGRQNLYVSNKDICRYAKKFMNVDLVTEDEFKDNEYSEPLFKSLRASLIDSLDNSTYERATVIHDLNEPIHEDIKNKYTAIVEVGLLEHIFNFPVAIDNCVQMLRVGGHFIGFMPANNLCGHGFYQFSPELLFRTFSHENGFKIKLMAMHRSDSEDFYLVKDSKDVQSRVMFQNNKPLELIVVAEKIKDIDLFSNHIQQSDYGNMRSAKDTESTKSATDSISTLRTLYREKIPKNIRSTIYDFYYNKIQYRKKNFRGFAKVHKAFIDKLNF